MPKPHSEKTQWLLALLALQEGRPVERAWLAGTLWPDSSEEQAAANLRRSLWYLRQALGAEGHRLETPVSGKLRLELVGVEADLLVFDEAIARGDPLSLERAVAVHRGPLLQGCVEEWVLQEREAREQAYLGALEALAAEAMAGGDHPRAARYLRRLVVADPLRDSAHRALMEALAGTGDVAAASQVYREFRSRLHEEMNATPDAETTALYQRIRAEARARADARRSTLDAQCLTPRRPAPLSLSEPSVERRASSVGSLPHPMSSLIGREREIAELGALLVAAGAHEVGRGSRVASRELDTSGLVTHDARLVTLTGPGGVGKTRLAIAVGRAVEDAYPDGVWFVDLGGLADPGLVPGTVACALRIEATQDEAPTELLLEFLRPRRLLLVLDNCEHLLDACAVLAETLLGGCTELAIVTTSRQPMGLTGERVWRAEPLLESDAVRLFVERAGEVVPRFRLTEANARAVGEVCRRLDGIPLALELAAARLRALSVQEVARRLEDRFRLLTQGKRTAITRQRTLAATLDWSYDLLEEPERALLRRLSVFAGGWSLEGAEAVCDFGFWILDFGFPTEHSRSASPRPAAPIQNPKSKIQNPEVLDLLTHLVDQSMVQVEEREGRSWYRLLETTREYARERLVEAGEEVAARDRHLAYSVGLAERSFDALRGPERGPWLDRLTAEHDNLRSALSWALESRQVAAALRMSAELCPFWRARGHLTEGRARLAALLAMPGAHSRTGVYATVLHGAGILAMMQGDHVSARPLLEESLDIRRKLDNKRDIAASLSALGSLAGRDNDVEGARAYHEECLVIAREARDTELIASALTNVAMIAGRTGDRVAARSRHEESLAMFRELGDKSKASMVLVSLGRLAEREGAYTAATAFLEESLALRRELGEKSGIAQTLKDLGDVAGSQGDFERAERLYAECLALRHELGDRRGIASLLHSCGSAARHRGDGERALELFCESAAIHREFDDRFGMAACLVGLAGLEVVAGRPRRAAGLFGATEGFQEAMRILLGPADQADCARDMAAARAQLGDEAIAEAWAEGRALSLEAALALAEEAWQLNKESTSGTARER
jgi:predicted ATPase/DNA-binding SARP family transcriptional activator